MKKNTGSLGNVGDYEVVDTKLSPPPDGIERFEWFITGWTRHPKIFWPVMTLGVISAIVKVMYDIFGINVFDLF
jgi:hypothetical protein